MGVSSFSCNLSLFDPPEDGLVEGFAHAFVSWHQSKPRSRSFRVSSLAVYRSMWDSLAAWCVSEGLPVQALSADDLARYLDSRGGNADLSDRYAWRMVTFVDRVLTAAAEQTGKPRNNAASEFLARKDSIRLANFSSDPLPSYLSATEAKRLVTYLSSARPRLSASPAEMSWQELRNRASVGLQLGAGLTPADIRSALLPHVISRDGRQAHIPWKIQISGNGTSKSREAPIAPWAGHLLRHWLDVRADMGIPGEVLFPSTRSGKSWGKVGQFESSKEVLRLAGIDEVEGGSFRLRHTFALRQLRRGKTPLEVAAWLGVTETAVLQKYGRILDAPVDVV